MDGQRFAPEEIHRFFGLSPDLPGTAGRVGYFHKLSPSWTRCLEWSLDELRRHDYGERFYKFHGLCDFEEKSDPAWQSRHLAASALPSGARLLSS